MKGVKITMRINSKTTIDEIAIQLIVEFRITNQEDAHRIAEQVKQAYDEGCLIWNDTDLFTSDNSRLNLRTATLEDGFLLNDWTTVDEMAIQLMVQFRIRNEE